VTELIPVTSSGKEVTDAMSATPTHVLPSPVFSAMMSPYRESRMPDKTITDVQMRKPSQSSTSNS